MNLYSLKLFFISVLNDSTELNDRKLSATIRIVLVESN